MSDNGVLRSLGVGLSLVAVASLALGAISYNYWIIAMSHPTDMSERNWAVAGLITGVGLAIMMAFGARRFFRLANENKTAVTGLHATNSLEG